MSSYVNRKIRVFKEAGDIELVKKRSDGRLKTYQSATDARSWCDSTEQRRQYILDLVRQGDGHKGLSLGKFIPIEAIIDILLANKNADIKRLMDENEELRRLLKKYGVKSAKKTDGDDDAKTVKYQSTAKDYTTPTTTKAPITSDQQGRAKQKEQPSSPPKPKLESTSKAPSAKIASIKEEPSGHPSRGAESDVEKMIGQPVDYGAEDDMAGSQMGGRPVEPKESSRGKTDGKDGRGGVSTTGQDLGGGKGTGQDLAGGKGTTGKDSPGGKGTGQDLAGGKGTTGKDSPGGKGQDLAGGKGGTGQDLSGGKGGAGQDLSGGKGGTGQDLSGGKGGAGQDLSGGKGGTGPDIAGKKRSSLDGRGVAQDDRGSRKGGSRDRTSGQGLGAEDLAGQSLGGQDYDGEGLGEGLGEGMGEGLGEGEGEDYGRIGLEEVPPVSRDLAGPSDQEQAAAEFLAMSPGDQVSALKNALAEKDASQRNLALAAIEQLEAIKDIVDDHEDLKRKLDKSQKELETLKASGSPALDSCKDEIEALEKEIQRMRASGAEPESAIVKKEMEVLKKYCAQLGAIQKENQELKKERDLLRQGLQAGVDDPNASEGIKDKLMKLEEVTQERDRLRGRVQQLENELKNLGNLPPSSGRTDMLDGNMDDLQRRLDALIGLEDEVRKLKKKAKECEQLDRKLLSSASKQSATNSELEKMKKNCEDAEALRKRIQELERELEMLKCKCRDAELLRVERDCLAKRLEDMDRLRRDYEDLLNRTKDYDAIKCELAKCKAKCEELQRLADECEELRAKVQHCEDMEKERQMLMSEIMNCECCINNQQDEIKRLACHINCLTDNLDKRQDQMKTKVCTMRAHLEKKDDLIAKSEQRLADVQCQLRNSIEGVSCETGCLRNRIEELENELTSKGRELAAKDAEIEKLNGKLQELLKVQAQLAQVMEENRRLQESSFTSDEHRKKMQNQMKCTAKCMKEKLAKYELGDSKDREDLLNRIKQLESELSEALKAMDQMKACGETSADRSSDSNIVAELRRRIEELEAQLRDALDRAKSSHDENTALRRNSVQLQENAKETISKLDAENKLLRSDSRKLDDVQGTMSDQDRIIADLRRQLQDEIRKREAAEEALRELEGKMKGLLATGDNDDLYKLQAEIDRLKNDLDNEKKRCQERIESLTSKSMPDDMKKAKSDVLMPKDAEVEHLQNELKEIKNANNALLQKISGLEAENQSLRDEIARLKAAQAAAAAAAPPPSGGEDFSRERDELLRQIEAQKGEIGDLVHKIKQPTPLDDQATLRELEDKNKENSRLKSLIDDLERQLRELKSAPKLPDIPQPVQDLQSLIDELTKKLQEEERKARDALASLTKCMEENTSGDLLKTNEKLKDRIGDLEDELARLRKAGAAQTGTLIPDCEEYIRKVKELEGELARQKKDCQDMVANLKGQYERDGKKLPKDVDDQTKNLDQRRGKDTDGFQEESKKSDPNLRRTQQDKGKGADAADERRRSSSIDPSKKKITSKVKVVKKDPSDDGGVSGAASHSGPSPPQKPSSQGRSPSQDRGPPQQQRPKSPERKSEGGRPSSPERGGAGRSEGGRQAPPERSSRDGGGRPSSPERAGKPQGGRPASPKRRPSMDQQQRAQTPEPESGRRGEPSPKTSQPGTAARPSESIGRSKPEPAGGRSPAEGGRSESGRPATRPEGGRPEAGPSAKSSEPSRPQPPAKTSEPSARPPASSPRGASSVTRDYDSVPPKTQQAQTKPLGRVKSDSTQKPEPIREASPSGRREPTSPQPMSSTRRESVIKSKEADRPTMKSPTREYPEDKIRPAAKEEKKPLSMRTFENVCICGKQLTLPSPPSSSRPVSPVRPCVCSSRASTAVAPSFVPHVPTHPPVQQQQQQIPQVESQQPMVICGGGHGFDGRKPVDKVSSMKKIADLENMLMMKQKQTKEKVENLQYTVDRVRRELELERQKNQDLINRYANQSQTVAHMIKELDIVKKEKFKDEQKLHQLNTTLKILEKDLDRERSTVQNLIGESSDLKNDDPCGCTTKMDPRIPKTGSRGCRIIPHFHTEVTLQNEDNRYKPNVMKQSPRSGARSCSCSGGHSSDTSDNFDTEEE